MILAIEANKEKFKPVEVKTGFNLVLARQGARKKRDPRKSTNGSGKTLLLLICHFCLGSDSVRQELCVPELAGWEFSLRLELAGREYRVTRSTDDPARVQVEGDFGDWRFQPARVRGAEVDSFAADEWQVALGAQVYGLDPEDRDGRHPTFGNLFRYAVRRGSGSFTDPFKSFPQQPAAERDVANAELLGVDWRPFRDAHRLLARRDVLKKTGQGIGEVRSEERGGARDLGELEADLGEVEEAIGRETDLLGGFRVHPRYREIEQEVGELTGAIRERSGEAVSRREALGFYRQALVEEIGVEPEEVRRLYAEAEVEFGDRVRRRLEEAEEFSRRLEDNRRQSLAGEIDRLEGEITALESEVEELDTRRRRALSSIDGSGAVDEFLQIRREFEDLSDRRGALRVEIEQRRGLEEQFDQIKVDLESNKPLARESLDAGRESLQRVAALFHEFTEELFETPGTLRIDVGKYGKLRLSAKIPGAGSQGIKEMMVFCYDLALAVSGAERGFGPMLLFHDSTIFDGVDARQKASALRLAWRLSKAHGFRYLLCINDGDLPWEEDIDREALESYLRVTLTDVDDGGLLGIRY
jgi:uncharacterized protein YydD (DUF2326 family)